MTSALQSDAPTSALIPVRSARNGGAAGGAGRGGAFGVRQAIKAQGEGGGGGGPNPDEIPAGEFLTGLGMVVHGVAGVDVVVSLI